MKNLLLYGLFLTWLLTISTLVLAQPSRTDVLHKTDQSTINVKIDELTDTEIVYSDPAAPTAKKRIARNQVWKIVFSDGSTEIITPIPGTNTAVGQPSPQPEPAKEAPVATGTPNPQLRTVQDYSAPNVKASYTDPKTFSRMHLTIGPEFAYYPDALNKDKAWLNDSTGFGMKQNVGASLRFDYLFLRRVGVSLTAGYYGWELVRRYTRDGVDEYTETKRLTQIPVQLGLKVYPFGSFYVMPEAGVNLLFASIKTSDTHPTPADESTKSTPITYGASLGYEIRSKALLLDLSLRYQIQNVKNLNYTEFRQSLSENVNIASIRIGIGFNAFKK